MADTHSERAPIQDVNIQLGDDISRTLYEASKQTYANRPGLLTEHHESFFGARTIDWREFPNPQQLVMNLGFDGVGTKVEIAERNKDHSTVAFDLFAMVCDDAVVRGAEAIAVGSILDVNQLDDSEETKTAIKQLAAGYVAAAREAGVVVVNGEVAELGDRIGGYGPFNYNWGASVLWIAHRDRLLTGRKIKAGTALVGLKEDGFRSNGITDVRKAMLEKYGPDWHNVIDPEISDLPLGKVVGHPSKIYSKFIANLIGGYDSRKTPWADVSGVAHITGGGQPSKLGRMLAPSGLGAEIDNPFDPPKAMLVVQNIRGLADEQAYGKWHMGPGMVVATSEPDDVLHYAQEAGIEAREIGKVVDNQSGDIYIKNKGAIGTQNQLRFENESL